MKYQNKYIVPLVLALFFLSPVKSNSAALTVLSVKAALEGAIESIRDTLSQTTNDMQSLGNSLQANAQNVLSDIDRMLGDKLSYTFDKLDQTELQLVEDAQRLTAQITKSAILLSKNVGDEARKSIVEADIMAYNASYSLPCRDAKPRVLASFPARFTQGRDTPILTLCGNFLRQGDNPIASVNGVSARVIERIDTQMTIEIPKEIQNKAIDREEIISVAISGLSEISRSLELWGLLGCHESEKMVSSKPIGLTIMEPPIHYELVGNSKYEYTAFREVAEPTQTFENIGSNKCNDNYRVDRQWCITGQGTFVRANVRVTSVNCNSGFEGTVPSGDRCVLARGKVGGCGANIGPFNTWLGCRGRGWLKYSISLVRREPYQTETAQSNINKVGVPGEFSFNFNLPSISGLNNPMPRYNLTIIEKQGNKTNKTISVSHANPNTDAVTTRVNGGVLSVEIAQ